ncbi:MULTISPECIES: hypothetical protein [unclassified Streptomyces]|uniref:hypothetical protein n=1 Tax=unclassified Streptomyces TaxID=2593676 RepID=UPI0035E0A5FA
MGHDLGLIASVQPDGYLQLFSPRTGKHHRCGPRGTTMWLALQRSNWHTESAAEEIAVRLDVDPDIIRCDIEAWMSHFREASW